MLPQFAVQQPSLDAADHRLKTLDGLVECDGQLPVGNSWARDAELVVGPRQGFLHLLLDVVLSYRQILPLQEVPLAGPGHVRALLSAVPSSTEGYGSLHLGCDLTGLLPGRSAGVAHQSR